MALTKHMCLSTQKMQFMETEDKLNIGIIKPVQMPFPSIIVRSGIHGSMFF